MGECTVTKEEGTQIASEERCSDKRKPKIERVCRLQACSASWFTASWSKCSQPCGQGEMVREVVCLRGDYRTVSQECMRADRPERVQECEEDYESQIEGDEDIASGDGSSNIDDIYEYKDAEEEEDDYGIDEKDDALFDDELAKEESDLTSTSAKLNSISSNEILPEKHWKMAKDEVCKDRFKNCNVVVQSRLCKYSFYQTNCCRSCLMLTKP